MLMIYGQYMSYNTGYAEKENAVNLIYTEIQHTTKLIKIAI